MRIAVFVAALALACEPMVIDTPDPETPSSIASARAVSTAAPASPATEGALAPALQLTAGEQDALDPRQSHMVQRASALLLTELSQLASLLQATPSDSPSRKLIMRRLAEDDVELAQACERDARLAEKPNDGSTTDMRTKMMAALRSQMAQTARRSAIRAYDVLVRSPSSTYPLVDQARYYMALEDVRAGDIAGARRTAAEVIARDPDSVWAARAHLLLGVDLATQAATDPSKHADAAKELTLAARTANGTLRRVVFSRLEEQTRLGDGVIDARPPATPPPSPLAPQQITGATTKPECSTDFDCPGAGTCRERKCADPFAFKP